MKKFKGSKVLVTRPKDQSDNLCQLIKVAGGEAIEFPSLQITPSEKLTKDQMRELLSWADHVVFISRNAVSYLDRLIGNISDDLKGKVLFAAGRGTVMALEKIGIYTAIYPSTQYGSEGLLELEELKSSFVAGKKLLIIRGNEGRELLREKLQDRGANVKYASIYSTKMPDVAPEIIESIWESTIPDIIVVTSNQGLQNLIEMTPQKYKVMLFSRKLVVMSNRIADTAAKAGFVNAPVVAEYQSDEGLIDAIQQSLEQ